MLHRLEAEALYRSQLDKAVSPHYFMSYLGSMAKEAGDPTQAVEWLEKAYQDHTVGMIGLKEDRFLDTIRDDPRFQDLMRRMNFPE